MHYFCDDPRQELYVILVMGPSLGSTWALGLGLSLL